MIGVNQRAFGPKWEKLQALRRARAARVQQSAMR